MSIEDPKWLMILLNSTLNNKNDEKILKGESNENFFNWRSNGYDYHI